MEMLWRTGLTGATVPFRIGAAHLEPKVGRIVPARIRLHRRGLEPGTGVEEQSPGFHRLLVLAVHHDHVVIDGGLHIHPVHEAGVAIPEAVAAGIEAAVVAHERIEVGAIEVTVVGAVGAVLQGHRDLVPGVPGGGL